MLLLQHHGENPLLYVLSLRVNAAQHISCQVKLDDLMLICCVQVQCHSYGSQCTLKVKSNTCYSCDIYHCNRWSTHQSLSLSSTAVCYWVLNCMCVCVSVDYRVRYYEFTGVSSCWDVVNLYRLLWACVMLNVLGVFLGIITAAILGAFKDLVSLDSSQTHQTTVFLDSTTRLVPLDSLRNYLYFVLY